MGLRRVLCIAIVLAGCGDNLKPEPDEDTVLTVVLETHAPAQVAAGDPIDVTCTLLENGIEKMVTGEIKAVEEDSVIRMGATVIARKVGTVDVACTLPGRGLTDLTPSTVEIVAGPAANLVTTITPNPVIAGNSVTATCEVYDAYGNPITDGEMPTLQLSPDDSANTITDLTALMIRTGHYTGHCYLPGTTSNDAGFDVLPNLPANIAVGKFPDRSVYALGETVMITHVVTDRYGNEIYDASITDTSAPVTGVGPTVEVMPGQFSYNGEGLYRVTASVDPPTDMDLPVTATTDILVNSKGPAITCADDATMLNVTPGAMLAVTGNANDVNGVSTVTVNGTAVPVDASGGFTANVPTRFGMNFVDVTAIDSFGEPTTRVCTFLVSDRYYDPAQTIDDTISLKLTQPAIDDFDRNGAIGSLGDVLYALINSDGLKDTVDDALTHANPLKPMSCDSQTCVPIFGCWCHYSSEIVYRDSRFPGQKSASLTLVDGGLRAVARMENIGVKLRVHGEIEGIDYDTTGWVDVSYIEIQVTLDTTVANGKPKISVRSGSVISSVGSIMTDFDGVDGWIIDHVVVPLAQGSLSNKLRDLISTFVTNNFNATLDGLIGNLDISTLGTTFNVPRLDGSGTIAMGFGLALSSLNTNANRALFGIGTKMTTLPANAFPTLGVPLPPSNNLLDPSVSSPANTAVAAHVGIFDHALHALWRANYFEVTLSGSQLGSGVPPEASLSVVTHLPPVATIAGTTVQLQLGALDLVVQHPSLPANLAVRFGADAHATVSLVGNDLTFGGIVIDEVHVSTDSINLDAQQQQDLEAALAAFAQQLVDQSLNNALPAIPIPAFTIPASLGQYGLPAGKQLGINNPSLSIAPQHFTLRGQFGIRP